MNRLHLRYLVAFVMLYAAPCFAHHLAVVVNKSNQVTNLTAVQLAKIVKGEMKKWPDGQEVVLILHKASEGEAHTLEKLTKTSDTQLKMLVESRKNSIQTIESDDDALSLVESISGAVAFVEVHAVNSQVNVVTVDGKLPTEAGYLSH